MREYLPSGILSSVRESSMNSHRTDNLSGCPSFCIVTVNGGLDTIWITYGNIRQTGDGMRKGDGVREGKRDEAGGEKRREGKRDRGRERETELGKERREGGQEKQRQGKRDGGRGKRGGWEREEREKNIQNTIS